MILLENHFTMLHKIISLKTEDTTLSIQNYKSFLLNLQFLGIKLFCQGSYVLHHALSKNITPHDIDIVGIYPDLHCLTRQLVDTPNFPPIRENTFFIQFNYGDCDITIYRYLNDIGIGLSNYDFISELMVTPEHVTLLFPFPKSNLTRHTNTSLDYIVYPFRDSLNVKGLYHYLYICLQYPSEKPYPSLAPIPETSQLDESKVMIYLDSYSIKLSKALQLPVSLCRLILTEYIHTTPLPRLHEKASALIEKFKNYIQTYRLLATLLPKLTISYEDFNTLFTTASYSYPYSKKTQALIPSLTFANKSLDKLTLELSKKLLSLLYQVPSKHILDDYFSPP